MSAIPTKREFIIDLASRAIAGLQAHGVALNMVHNTAIAVSTDLYTLIGEPGAGTNAGKQALLNEKRAAVGTARTNRHQAIADGRKFCADAVDILKPKLGRRWNAQWQAAGFSQFSLALPREPLALLLELRNYFRGHPTHEDVDNGITAAQADAKATALQAANQALDAAKSDRTDAAEARDGAITQLRHRLLGTRNELGESLDDDDNRWLDFGFSRPIDGSMPTAVTGLTVTPGLPGTVLVQWDASVRAINYRVSWRIAGSSAEPTEVGLFADRAVNLGGLSSGATITVQVTARNNSGETQATEVNAVVP